MKAENPDVDALAGVLTELGVNVTTEETPERLLESARSVVPEIAIEVLIAFIAAKVAEKAPRGIETTKLLAKCIRFDLKSWVNRPAGRAASDAIEAAERQKRFESVCKQCSGRGTNLNTGGFCECEVGQQIKDKLWPEFVLKAQCLRCSATLGFHPRSDPQRVQCAYCNDPNVRANMNVDIEAERQRLGAQGRMKPCRTCQQKGYTVADMWGANALTEYCGCEWGKRKRMECGDEWPAQQTRQDRETYQRLHKLAPGKSPEVAA